MRDTAKALLQIRKTSSTLDKQHLLRTECSTPTARAILKFIYNPYFKTCISDAKLDNAPLYKDAIIPESVYEIMDYIVNHPTGDKETCGIVNTWMHRLETPEERWLARGLITQNLQIGVSVTTLNKVFGADFIPKISCMLGTPLDKIGHQKWPYIVTEKLDGVRRIMIKQNGQIRFYSRSGHLDEGLGELEREAAALPDNYMYDGELLAKGEFVDSIAQRQATSSLANRKGQKTGLTFNIFDMVPVNEFLAQSCSATSLQRKRLLAATFQDQSGSLLVEDPMEWPLWMASRDTGASFDLIRSVPILAIAHTMEDIEPVVSALWEQGREGVMLNAPKAPYVSKRTKDLVKLKKTQSYRLRVEGFVEGTNKYEGMLGSLLTMYKDCYLQVGSGFSDAQRWEIWQNQDKYQGMIFEVESFGESTNVQGLVSLNCPIFKRWIEVDHNKLFVE